ncbi:MAG: hypothetical protein AB1592_09445 [Pseudomonadota bacterium]
MNHLSHARPLPSFPPRQGALTPLAPNPAQEPLAPLAAGLRQQQQVRRIDPCRDQQQREHQHGEC